MQRLGGTVFRYGVFVHRKISFCAIWLVISYSMYQAGQEEGEEEQSEFLIIEEDRKGRDGRMRKGMEFY